MSRPPLVSVITATYNMADYVCEAIDSVLAQTVPDVQCVVVDDGSTDRTREVLARYADDPRVKVLHQENAGQTVSKNRGLAAADGEYVGFCDADDRWRPEKLAVQLPLLRERPEVGVVYADFQCIGPAGEDVATPRWTCPSGRITGALLADNFVHFPTVLTRKAILEEFGGFDESLSMAIDYDLWLRVSTRYDFLHVPQVLVDYRIWGGQMSHRTGERLDNAFRMMENFLARHPDSVSKAEADRAWAHTYVTRGIWHVKQGRPDEARADFGRALGHRPLDARLWKTLVKWALRRPLA